MNPTGFWSHVGAYTVLISDDATTSIVPDGVQVDGRIVRVTNGRVYQSMGGIQLEADGRYFFWGYAHLKEIRDGEGALIWRNKHYNPEE